ncbi:MAG: dapF [Gammaproteobacteria bacterium]|nr:dapF [Gammaproteobacteria bacterium]
MHSLGNDFIVIDAVHHVVELKEISIPLLADRHLGIGFDQLLLIEKSSKADFACRIFNADGSEAEHCGNGMRCVARFIQEEKLSQKKLLTLETLSGLVEVVIHPDHYYQVKMGIPRIEPIVYPMDALSFAVVSIGNPHAILCVPSIQAASVIDISSKIAAHSVFAKGANVGFMEIINPRHIRLRTIERGAGETLACGSNACAAVVAGVFYHGLEHKVTVTLTHGDLLVEWLGEHSPVVLSGSAIRVFSGSYPL